MIRGRRVVLQGTANAEQPNKRQGIQAGLQNACERGGNAQIFESFGFYCPTLVFGVIVFNNHAVFNQNFDQFFNIKWITVSTLDNQIAQFVRHII